MKKKVMLCIILFIVIGTSAVIAQEQPTLDKLRFTALNNGTGWAVRAANNSISGDVIIPATYEGVNVVSASSNSGFNGNTRITSVIFPNTFITLGTNLFRDCTGLTSVIIPASIVTMNANVFNGCTNLTRVTFYGTPGSNINTGAFPGDLVTKWRAGGAGIYTRTAGNTVWTRIGDAPALQPINLSLDGTWVNGGMQITINSGTGVLSSLPASLNTLWTDAVNKGFISVGSQFWRNLRSTGNLTWSGQEIEIRYETRTPNVATSAVYRNATFTMSSDGRTITVTGGLTWTRR